MNKFTICCVCRGLNKEPQRIKNCNHLVCLECVSKVRKKDTSWRCPFCNEIVVKCKLDLVIKEIVDELLNATLPCSIHPNEQYFMICEQCTEPVCRNCVMESHNGHKFISSDNPELIKSVKEKMRTELQQYEKTTEHLKETLEEINRVKPIHASTKEKQTEQITIKHSLFQRLFQIGDFRLKKPLDLNNDIIQFIFDEYSKHLTSKLENLGKIKEFKINDDENFNIYNAVSLLNGVKSIKTLISDYKREKEYIENTYENKYYYDQEVAFQMIELYKKLFVSYRCYCNDSVSSDECICYSNHIKRESGKANVSQLSSPHPPQPKLPLSPHPQIPTGIIRPTLVTPAPVQPTIDPSTSSPPTSATSTSAPSTSAPSTSEPSISTTSTSTSTSAPSTSIPSTQPSTSTASNPSMASFYFKNPSISSTTTTTTTTTTSCKDEKSATAVIFTGQSGIRLVQQNESRQQLQSIKDEKEMRDSAIIQAGGYTPGGDDSNATAQDQVLVEVDAGIEDISGSTKIVRLPTRSDPQPIKRLKNIFFLCGMEDKLHLSRCVKYNPASDEWIFMPPSKHKRACVTSAAVIVGHMIYLFGGNDSLESYEKFNTTTNRWDISGNCNIANGGGSSMSACYDSLHGCIYLVGGVKFNQTSFKIERCTINKNENWSLSFEMVATLRFPRYYCFTIIHNNLLYIIGGTNKTRDEAYFSIINNIEVLDLSAGADSNTSETWLLCENLDSNNNRIEGVCFDGISKFYIITIESFFTFNIYTGKKHKLVYPPIQNMRFGFSISIGYNEKEGQNVIYLVGDRGTSHFRYNITSCVWEIANSKRPISSYFHAAVPEYETNTP